MRALWLAAIFVLSGCSDFDIPTIPAPADMAGLDECTAAPADRSCVTLHIRGDSDPFDTVQIDALFELGGGYVARRTISHNPGGAVAPPVAVGVILTLDAGDSITFKVLASNGDTPVGLATVDVSGLRPGDHDAEEFDLEPVAKTRCFDGVKDGDETDVDCGWIGECPVCTIGNICISPQDCANSSCVLVDDDGNYVSRCQ